MFHYGWDSMYGWGSMGFFGMFIFWILIIIIVVSLIPRREEKNGKQKYEKSALDILKERYAKGEINKKEFEEKKKDIGE